MPDPISSTAAGRRMAGPPLERIGTGAGLPLTIVVSITVPIKEGPVGTEKPAFLHAMYPYSRAASSLLNGCTKTGPGRPTVLHLYGVTSPPTDMRPLLLIVIFRLSASASAGVVTAKVIVNTIASPKTLVTIRTLYGGSGEIDTRSERPIHRSAWKGNSPKSLCSILYREARAQPITLLNLVLRTASDYDILYERIKMRWRGYIAFACPRHTLVHAVK